MKIKDGKPELNRCLYKDVKRMDHHAMETFLTCIYQQGVEHGVKKEQSEPSGVRKRLLQVKGIGEKMADAILDKLTEEQ